MSVVLKKEEFFLFSCVCLIRVLAFWFGSVRNALTVHGIVDIITWDSVSDWSLHPPIQGIASHPLYVSLPGLSPSSAFHGSIR